MFFWEFSNLILSWIHSHIAFIVIVDAGTGHTMGQSLIRKRSFFVCGPSYWINCDRKQVSIRNGSMALILIELRAHKMGWCSISQKIDVWQQFSAKIATCCSAERVSCSKVERSEKVRTELMSEEPSFQLTVYPLPLSTLYFLIKKTFSTNKGAKITKRVYVWGTFLPPSCLPFVTRSALTLY